MFGLAGVVFSLISFHFGMTIFSFFSNILFEIVFVLIERVIFGCLFWLLAIGIGRRREVDFW